MVQIQVNASKLMGFYTVWEENSRRNKSNSNKVEKDDFSELMENLKYTYPDFSKMVLEDYKAYYPKRNRIRYKTAVGSIKSVDELADSMVRDLPVNKELFLPNFKQAFQKYERFWEQNEELILQNQKVLENFYKQGIYYERFNKLCHFFDYADDKVSVLLHPYPTKVVGDGFATPFGDIHFCISLKKTKDEKKYLKNSTILLDKVGCPLHECTHMLFENSPARKQLDSNEGASLQQLFGYLVAYYEKSSQEEDIRCMALSALHEGFASAGGVVKQLNDSEQKEYCFYEGLDEGNHMGRAIYPVMEKYLKQDKQLDDTFFKEVLESEAFQKAFVEPLRKQEASRCGKIPPLNNQKNASR